MQLLIVQGEHYRGKREKEDMVDYVMGKIPATVLKLNAKNLKPLSEEWDQYKNLPWILDFCDVSESCLSPLTRKKLSAVLDGLFNVGTVNCISNGDVCNLLGKQSAVAYFPVQSLKKEAGVVRAFQYKQKFVGRRKLNRFFYRHWKVLTPESWLLWH